MPLLELPEPYDFEVSTERFRAFGPDLANLWHEGGLHRVVGGREVRIEAAPGGVDVEPLDAGDRAGRARSCSAPSSTSTAFYGLGRAGRARRCGGSSSRLDGFRPPLAPDPFETLVTSITAQQVSLFAAFAIRNRLIERFGVRGRARVRASHARALAARDRGRDRRVGFSCRKAEYVLGLARADLDLDGLAALPDEEVQRAADGDARHRRVDGRLVPRAPPRAAARLACRRPRPAQGGRGLLR